MTTTEDLRRQNDLKVLKMLTDREAVTKNDVAEEIGVTLVTASKIIKRFHERGMLNEIGSQESDRGRKASLYELNGDAFYIVAVAISLSGFTVAVNDARMRRVCALEGKLDRRASFEKSWDAIRTLIAETLAEHGIRGDEILGIGYTVPGTVDAQSGVISFLPNMRAWNGADLKRASEEAFGARTFVEKDNYAAVLYLQEQGGEPLKNAALMTIRGGIGCGIILNNALVRGENGLAGEIGHIRAGKDGRICACGNADCLETYASDDAIVKALRDKIRAGSARDIPELDARGITAAIEACLAGHAEARSLFDEAAEMLGESLTVVLRCYDPDAIFVDCEYVRGLDFVRQKLAGTIASRDTMPKRSKTRFVVCPPGDYSLLGAGLIVYNDVFRHYAHNIIIE